VGSAESRAADLAILTQACGDPDTDLETQSGDAIAVVKRAIVSYQGLSVAISGDDQTSVSVHEHGDAPIATSLMVPLSGPRARTALTLTLYASMPGALVDLGADLSYALALGPNELIFDHDLAPTQQSGMTGLARRRVINQAIGVLIEGGYTAESAEEELRKRAALDVGDVHTTAQALLREGHEQGRSTGMS
jgi:hypothetical protein